jgi:hypothetical protein
MRWGGRKRRKEGSSRCRVFSGMLEKIGRDEKVIKGPYVYLGGRGRLTTIILLMRFYYYTIFARQFLFLIW